MGKRVLPTSTKGRDNILSCAIIGFFSFPTLFYCASLLFIFQIALKIENKTNNSKFFRFTDKFIPAASIFIYVISILYIIYSNIPPCDDCSNKPVNKKILFISLFFGCLYLFKVFQNFWDSKRFFEIAQKINFFRLSTVLFIFLLLKFVTNYYSSSAVSITIQAYLIYVLTQSITNPLCFLVSHFFYYGITLSLIIFYWHDFKQKVRELGAGFELIVIAYLFLAIGSESRQFINALPFFVLPIVLVMSKYNFKARFYYILLILNLFFSKVWYPINQEEFVGDNIFDFPWQNYFMHQGPWMSNNVYYIKALLVLLGMFVIYRSIKKYGSTENRVDKEIPPFRKGGRGGILRTNAPI